MGDNEVFNFVLFCFLTSLNCWLLILGGALLCTAGFAHRKKKNEQKYDPSNDYIKDYLDSYLNMNKPGFAVLITGPWGCGKTHFIKHYRKRRYWFNVHCYVSLFGVENKKDFEFKLWKGILFANTYITFAYIFILCVTFMLIRGLILSILEKDNIALLVSLLPALGIIAVSVWQVGKYKARDWLLRGRYLILDDLERVSSNPLDVLAYINEIVEHSNLPVIIIANANEINRSSNNSFKEIIIHKTNKELYRQVDDVSPEPIEEISAFDRQREKVIGKTLSLQSNDLLIVKALLSQLPKSSALRKIVEENLNWFITLILTPLHKNEQQTNYRALQHCFRDFEYYFSRGKTPTYLSNPKIWKELIPRFFALKYALQVRNITTKYNFNENLAKKLVRLNIFIGDTELNPMIELYPCWNNLSHFLNENIWDSIIDNHSLETEKIEKILYSYLAPQLSLVDRLQQAYKMDDTEFNDILSEIKNVFQTHSIHVPEDIIAIINIMLQFSERSLIPCSLEEIKAKAIEYISAEANNLDFQAQFASRGSFHFHKGTIDVNLYSSYLKDDAILKEITNELINTMKFAAKVATGKDIEIFQQKILDSTSDFDKWFFQDNNNTYDFYSMIDIDEFWSQFSMLPTRCFVERLYALRSHIQSESGIDQMMHEERNRPVSYIWI